MTDPVKVFHKDLTSEQGIHGSAWKEVANEAARLALNSDPDVGISKVVYQYDQQVFYICSSLSPVKWDRLTKTVHLHEQATASQLWTIDHGMGRKPNVAMFDRDGKRCECKEENPTLNRTLLYFSAAVGGSATLT